MAANREFNANPSGTASNSGRPEDASKTTLCCGLCRVHMTATEKGVPRRQPHRRSGLATLPSVAAVL